MISVEFFRSCCRLCCFYYVLSLKIIFYIYFQFIYRTAKFKNNTVYYYINIVSCQNYDDATNYQRVKLLNYKILSYNRGAKTWVTVFTCYSGIYTTQHGNGITILYLFNRYIPLATVINFISPFSQFDAYIHKLLDIDIWFLATTQKLRKSPAFQFLVLAVNHFVLMAILNIIIYLSNIYSGNTILSHNFLLY